MLFLLLAPALVCRLAYNGDVVAFKMGSRQGGPSRTGELRGRISKSMRNRFGGRRPIFYATLWPRPSWLFFLHHGGSARMHFAAE
jgi:hypothetical protein